MEIKEARYGVKKRLEPSKRFSSNGVMMGLNKRILPLKST